jgi:hypothetical protein
MVCEDSDDAPNIPVCRPPSFSTRLGALSSGHSKPCSTRWPWSPTDSMTMAIFGHIWGPPFFGASDIRGQSPAPQGTAPKTAVST